MNLNQIKIVQDKRDNRKFYLMNNLIMPFNSTAYPTEEFNPEKHQELYAFIKDKESADTLIKFTEGKELLNDNFELVELDKSDNQTMVCVGNLLLNYLDFNVGLEFDNLPQEDKDFFKEILIDHEYDNHHIQCYFIIHYTKFTSDLKFLKEVLEKNEFAYTFILSLEYVCRKREDFLNATKNIFSTQSYTDVSDTLEKFKDALLAFNIDFIAQMEKDLLNKGKAD